MMQRTSPSISGREPELQALMSQDRRRARAEVSVDDQMITSCFACALHMHQPTIPAGVNGELISHLQYMFEHSNEGDNHNAEAFAHCYRRLADIIPELINDGCKPRIMLDYSGNLLWGFAQMQRKDIIGALKYLTSDRTMQEHVEWLGTFWGHAVAPSTPVQDFKLQISAWQHQFAVTKQAVLIGSELVREIIVSDFVRDDLLREGLAEERVKVSLGIEMREGSAEALFAKRSQRFCRWSQL